MSSYLSLLGALKIWNYSWFQKEFSSFGVKIFLQITSTRINFSIVWFQIIVYYLLYLLEKNIRIYFLQNFSYILCRDVNPNIISGCEKILTSFLSSITNLYWRSQYARHNALFMIVSYSWFYSFRFFARILSFFLV